MALNNAPFPVVQASAALVASSVLNGLGITSNTQHYYGQTAPGVDVFVPASNAPSNLPALVIESSTPGGGSRTGFSAGAGTTSYHGVIVFTVYLAVTDYGTLETAGWNLIDDLINQGGTNLNIIDVEILQVDLPNQALQSGDTAGQPGMPVAAFCTLTMQMKWEG